MFLAALRDMPLMKTEPVLPARIERERAGLPAPVKKAATALAIGTALQIGVGLAGRYLATQATKTAVNAATRPKPVPRRAKGEPARDVTPHDQREDATAISETVMIRRVWIRRG